MPCDVAITQAGRRLIASGSAIATTSDPIEIRVEYLDDYLIFEFYFRTNEDREDTYLSTEIPEPDTLRFLYFNVKYNELATYKAYGPEKIGSIAGKDIWFANYIRQVYKEGAIQIFYSAWIDERNNG